MGSAFEDTNNKTYEKPEEFFPYLRNLLEGKNSAAVIIDYSDYLFGYGQSLSEDERKNITNLMLAIERGQDYGLNFVKGQNEAIKKVRDVIIRAYTGFAGLQHSTKQKKPKGALFFVGPTGVGKTELAKALAEFIFGDENSYRRFDMSEYAHEQNDQRLVGAPPGYVGYFLPIMPN